MSDADGGVAASAASDEEVEPGPPPTSRGTPAGGGGGGGGGRPGGVDAGLVEGKRAKKTVERLDFQTPKQKQKLRIGDGSGEKLGDLPRTSYQISRMKPADLKPLHAILFDRPGKVATIKKNLRLFNGFAFHGDSEAFARKRERLLRKSSFTNSKLKVVCGVLDLEKKGTHSDLVDRIMNFLLAPKNSGRRLPVRRKRRSKKKLSAADAAAKARSRTKPAGSSKTGSKSKAIVMDSSSDEEEGGAAGHAHHRASDTEGERADPEEGSEECPRSRRAAPKRQRARAAPPPPPRPSRSLSDGSGPDGDAPEKTGKEKPAAGTRKAHTGEAPPPGAAEDGRDEEAPVAAVRKAPGERELRETVRSLLREADLEETTMKELCRRVFDRYPGHDLSGRKDYIKRTVKTLITGSAGGAAGCF